MDILNGEGAGVAIVAMVVGDVGEVGGESWGGKSGHDEADEHEDAPSLPTWEWSNWRVILGHHDSAKPRHHIAVLAARLDIRL